jgi:hypothetical protein
VKAIARFFAVGYWLWSAFIAIGAGFIGAILNCEYGDCEDGFPTWYVPWTWGDYYVYPEVTLIALGGLAAATTFAALVFADRRFLSLLVFGVSLAVLSYPFFAGLTAEGRALFGFGPLLGLVAVAVTGFRDRTFS